MKVKAGELRNALHFLHSASNAFGSKYFVNYFTFESDGVTVWLRASTNDAIAQVELSSVEGAEPVSVVTTTKIFKLIQLIPAEAEAKLEFSDSGVKISVEKSTWYIPKMAVDELPMPPLLEEEPVARVTFDGNWRTVQSFLSVVAPYSSGGGSFQQPSVYFEVVADEGVCYCVGFSGREALIDKIPAVSTADAKFLAPYNIIKPIAKFTPSEMEVFPTGVRFKGNNWWLLAPLLSEETTDHRFFRRIYEKVRDETLRCSFRIGRKELNTVIQRLKAVIDIGGVIKYVGGGIEARVEPVEDGLLFSAYSVSGDLLAQEIVSVRDLQWDANISLPIRVNTESLQHALNAFNTSPELEFAFSYDDERSTWAIGRVTSQSQPYREAYFALLVSG